MRTLLVGLDAACLDVLEPLFEAGETPTLQSLMEDGASGPLESQVPPWTASAWPSLYTGVNPGKHGVFDFLAFDGYDWDVVNATHVGRRTVWEYLDHHGLSSVVVNAPVTHPPRPFDGALVPGYLAPEGPTCHPEGLLDDIQETIGEYRVYAKGETDERRGDRKFDQYLALTRQRGEAFRYLADRFDPDFGFVQFQKTDAVFHDFPGDDEKVRGVYRAVDEQVGAILDAQEPETVVVASDHGIGPYAGHEFRVNERLRREGHVETTRSGRSVPSWFQIKDESLVEGSPDADSGGGTVLRQLAALAARLGLTYQVGKAVLDRFGLAEFVGRHVPVAAVYAASKRVDYAASRAYLRSPSELGLRLNVEGREPNGTVSESDYETVRAQVIELLEDVTTPDGDPIFESVRPREAVFDGPYVEEAVDIVAVPASFEHSLSALIGDEFTQPEPYNHKPEGLIGITGEGVDTDASLDGAHLFDVAPTVLATLGVPPDESMDGRILSAVEPIDPEAYPDYEPVRRTRTDDADVEDRLADLGYLE